MGREFEKLTALHSFAGIVASISLLVMCSCSPAPSKINVIFISLDTTRADHIGCYGSQTARTPNLDAFADESVLFEDYRTVVPTTLASHLSLFTGKFPHTHGVPRNGFVANRKNVLLTQILKKAGYRTIGVIGSFALDSRFGFARGFDEYDQEFSLLAGSHGREQSQRPANEVTDTAIDYLRARDDNKPLFLFVHYFDPHAPYEPPSPYDTMYDPRPETKQPPAQAVIRQVQERGGKTPDSERLAALYAGEVSFMDEHIGRLFRYLEEASLLDNAIIVVTSDHGENFWEHELYFNHGMTVYETVMRAVCVIRLPQALNGGTRVSGPMSNVDVLPTLLSYLGYRQSKDHEGIVIDLKTPPMRLPERQMFGEASKPWEDVETGQKWKNALKARCVVDGYLKYIQTPYKNTEELYDLRSDPVEQHDLMADAGDELMQQAQKMRNTLEEWTASANPFPSHFDASQVEETIRRLKDLGYLE